MLKKFDLLAEKLLQEGRKSDENKKFSLNLEVAKKIVNDLEDGHEDKSHFKTIVDKLSDKPYHTPKSFRSDVARIFRKLRKDEIADGYAKIFYKFLIDHEECPCSPYKGEEKEELEDIKTEEEPLEFQAKQSARSNLPTSEPQNSAPTFGQGKGEETA